MGFVYEGTMVDLGGGRGWLNGAAAASLWRLDAEIGRLWGINEAGRTWDQQNEHYQRYLRTGYPIALSPDAPSLHQRGNAIDTNDRITGRLNDHGWYQTVYRWVNGVWTLVEPWHYEYFPDRDNHINESPALPEPAIEEGDRDMAVYHWGPDDNGDGTSTPRGGVLLTDDGPYYPTSWEEANNLKADYGRVNCDLSARDWDVALQANKNRVAARDDAPPVEPPVEPEPGEPEPPKA
jgi:hypothetical protein